MLGVNDWFHELLLLSGVLGKTPQPPPAQEP
jgi:hypothetical protein